MADEVRLVPVTAANVRAVCALRVAPGQETFVSSNAESLAEAQFRAHAWVRAVYLADEPVGLVMLYSDPSTATYVVWRLMVAEGHQRRGVGRAVMEQVIEHVRGQPGAVKIKVGAVAEDGGPGPFYEGIGFRPTGRVDGDNEAEYVLELGGPRHDVAER